MPTYDPTVLQKYADDLYDRADMVRFKAFCGWGFISGIISFLIVGVVLSFQKQPSGNAIIPAGVVGIVFGAIGVIAAGEKVFLMRLEAQKILLQMRIEENTRAIDGGAKSNPPVAG